MAAKPPPTCMLPTPQTSSNRSATLPAPPKVSLLAVSTIGLPSSPAWGPRVSASANRSPRLKLMCSMSKSSSSRRNKAKFTEVSTRSTPETRSTVMPIASISLSTLAETASVPPGMITVSMLRLCRPALASGCSVLEVVSSSGNRDA